LVLDQEEHATFEINVALIDIASLWMAQGFAARAVRLFGAAQGVLNKLDASLGVEQRRYDRYLAAARAQLDEPAFAQAWAEGQAMTLEQAVVYALEDREGRG
jgi:hypothetical protein